ncbi:MAG: Ku protein [Phycisphaerae bacterium]|nr:Ku protein [Gemmatimonadaceae bacterium]
MPRGIWKGTMGFGLVTIGVELLTAEQTEDLDLSMLDRRDNAHIGYQKINKSTGDVVPNTEIVKGFEVSDGKYVVLTPDDLKSANPKATQSVDIVAFVSQDDIPLIFYAKPYYVSPLKGSDKAYALLRDALMASKQVGIAQIVIHTRQHMAVVYPHQESIVVQLLRYAHELKQPEVAGVKLIPHAAKGSRAPEFTMAQQLIESMVAPWKPEQYKDTYHDDVMKMVNARAKKGAKASPASTVEAPTETKVLDLVAALRGSLKKGAGATARAAHTPDRKPAAKSAGKTATKTAAKKRKSA